jgi:hypothetical protein
MRPASAWGRVSFLIKFVDFSSKTWNSRRTSPTKIDLIRKSG